jgi:hypothetical protein
MKETGSRELFYKDPKKAAEGAFIVSWKTARRV